MQQVQIKKYITGRGKQRVPDHYKLKKDLILLKERLRDERVVREIHYFKTKLNAFKFMALDLKKDPYSKWGKPFIDKTIAGWAVYKYRNY